MRDVMLAGVAFLTLAGVAMGNGSPPVEPPAVPPTRPPLVAEDGDSDPGPAHMARGYDYCCIHPDAPLQRVVHAPGNLFVGWAKRQCQAQPLASLKVCTDRQMGWRE